jgi:hypothetical protein
MKAKIVFFLIYMIFSHSIYCQNDSLSETIVTGIVSEDLCKTIIIGEDSIVPPQLVNECGLSESIARVLFFTNEFSISDTLSFDFSMEFFIDVSGNINKENYKSECNFNHTDYSVVYKDIIIRSLDTWKPAFVFGKNNLRIPYQIIVLIKICKQELIIKVLNSKKQLIEQVEFSRPLFFK